MTARLLTLLTAALLSFAGAVQAFAAEKRIALVIGEAAYARPLPTAANDAGLIAQTLQAAGFDVTGARDLDSDSLRSAFREFLDKASQAGPETAAVIYFSGVALQLEGENYLAPVNAAIARDTDIPLQAVRISDYLRPLAALNLKAAVVVLDAARENPFQLAGQPIAGGLALYEPGAGAMLAFNTAPGAIARDGAGPYGPYAHALAEMMRAGGMSLAQVFDETRLRVSESTKGAQVPWNSIPPKSSFVFFERTAGAPPRPDLDPALQDQPMAQLGPEGAYAAAVSKDSLQGYRDYLAIYPGDPMSKRVRALLAARREALYWRRARTIDTPEAYWSYLRRYQRGPHCFDAQRMLALRSAELAPPPSFAPIDFGYPPPPEDELVYVGQSMIYFGDPVWGFAPPPPPPVYLLPPPPPDFVVLPPPFVVAAAFVLPVPVFVPAPAYIVAPAYIAPPPPNNIVFANIHNRIEFNQTTNNFVVTSPQGQTIGTHALTAVGAVGAAAAVGVALPHVINKLAPGPGSLPGANPAPANHALPTQLPATTPLTKPVGPSPTAPLATRTPLAPLSKPAASPIAPTQPVAPTGPHPLATQPVAPQLKPQHAVVSPPASNPAATQPVAPHLKPQHAVVPPVAPQSNPPAAPQLKPQRAVVPPAAPHPQMNPPSQPKPQRAVVAPPTPQPAVPAARAVVRAPPPKPAAAPQRHCANVGGKEVCR